MIKNVKFMLISTTSLLFLLMPSGLLAKVAESINETASFKDAKYAYKGINEVTLSVADIDKMLVFYTSATGFDVIDQYGVNNEPSFDKLYGKEGLSAKVAILKAPNMQLKLIEFEHNQGSEQLKMPFYQQGITHTCFQSPLAFPSYNSFKEAGAVMLSRGEAPVDLGGYGVTYAYGYDPEGNMIEMEQLADKYLQKVAHDTKVHTTWMTQVAFATPNREKLIGFYADVLGFEPFRLGEYKGNPRMDNIVDWDNVHLKGGWFKIGSSGEVLEVWEFIEPTTKSNQPAATTALGYSFAIEVDDLDAEYSRLKERVEFISEPVLLFGYKSVMARDIDGNVFEMREKRY